MRLLGALSAFVLIGAVLLDAFEAIILPRRVRHGYRLARLYYQGAWGGCRLLARRLPSGRWRNGFLSAFGPLSLFGLIAVWAAGLIAGFAVLNWSFANSMSGSDASLTAYLYLSGTTFFTLGYGDLVPTGALGRVMAVMEAGVGFGFLALVISYLPVLHQAFSRREIVISLLDARAGSPPTAAEILRRRGAIGGTKDGTVALLGEWERWAAEVLESHLSFPVLSYYRSQHDNQSWLAALNAILDTAALLIAAEDDASSQARLTFAMARHAAVDLGLMFQTPPRHPVRDRLPEPDRERLHAVLEGASVTQRAWPAVERGLAELRPLYEPFIEALAVYFEFAIPPFVPEKPPVDNWQTSPWMKRTPSLRGLSAADDEHLD